MTAIFLKLVSTVMSVVVFISGTFPGLFGDREYIYPSDGAMLIIDQKISDDCINDSVIIKDYESYKALGNYAISCDEEYFKENALAIITLEYQTGDEIFIKSIYKEGAVYEIEYYYLDNNLTMIYSPEYMTFIIPTTKDTRQVHAFDPLHQSQIKLYEFLGIIE